MSKRFAGLLWLVGQSAFAAELSPEEAVKLALQYDPALAAAGYDVDAASSTAKGEEHAYGVTLGLDANGQHVSSPAVAAGTAFVGVSNSVQGAVTARGETPVGLDVSLSLTTRYGATTSVFDPNQPAVVNGPRLTTQTRLTVVQAIGTGAGLRDGWSARDQARQRVDSAKVTEAQSASLVVRDTLLAWWEAAYATAALRVQETALATAVEERKQESGRVDAGAKAPVVLLALDTRVATAEEAVATARADADARLSELQRRIGVAELPEVTLVVAPTPPPPSADVAAMAVESAPSVAVQREAVELAKITASTAGDALEPSLAVTGWLQLDSLRDVPTDAAVSVKDAVSGFVGLSGTLAVDRTRHSMAVSQAALAVQAAEQRLADAERTVAADVRSALIADASARTRVDLAARTLEIAQRQVEAERSRVAAGSGLQLEVRQAEDDARSAELRLLRARVDLVSATLRLQHLTGELVRVAAEGG